MQKTVVGAIAAVAIAGIAYWAGTQKGAPAPESAKPAAGAAKGPPPVFVEASKVSVVQLPQALAAVGSLRSDETVILRPEVAGRVSQINFREGERVTKGQVLVKLDNSVQQADVDRARANLTLSRTKHERSIDLRNKGFISNQALEEAENGLKVAQADAELMSARHGKTSLLAPFSGTVGLRLISVGDYVKEGQDLVNLESLDPLKVDFRVPELALSQVRDGQTLQITLDAIPDKACSRAYGSSRPGRKTPSSSPKRRCFPSARKNTSTRSWKARPRARRSTSASGARARSK
jgi:membrane fusion protein (multidrug efflux system)